MAIIQLVRKEYNIPLNVLSRIRFYKSRKIDDLRLVTDRYEGFWKKTKDDDSEVGGEKNLVDDTRFLRTRVLRHCLFLLRLASLPFPPVHLLWFNVFDLKRRHSYRRMESDDVK